MTTNNLISTCLVGFSIFAMSCVTKVGNADKIQFAFDRSDSLFIKHILSIYDKHVEYAVGDSLPLGEAYRYFIKKADNDMDKMCPDIDIMLDFQYDLITGHLVNNFCSAKYHGDQFKCWDIFTDFGHMSSFVQWFEDTHPAWNGIYEGYTATGDFPPTMKRWVMNNYDVPNFADEHERFIVGYMFMTGLLIFPEAFVLKMDVEKNREAMASSPGLKNLIDIYEYDYDRTH